MAPAAIFNTFLNKIDLKLKRALPINIVFNFLNPRNKRRGINIINILFSSLINGIFKI